MRIMSTQNHRIMNVVKLHQPKHRNRQGRMLIEGYRCILRAVDNGYPLQELYFCPPLFFGGNERTLIEQAVDAGVRPFEVTEEPFRKMCLGHRPEGLLAVALQIHRPLCEHRPANDNLYIIAESRTVNTFANHESKGLANSVE